MREQSPSLTAIVVNYNAGAVLQQCVRALLAAEVPMQVCVVDNASGDDSIDSLQAALGHPSAVRIERNTSNEGFSRAVNACARELDSEFILVVNPDCVVAPGAVQALLDAAASADRAGLAAPRVVDPGGQVERASLRRFPRPWNSLMAYTGLWRLGRWWPALRGVAVREVDDVHETITAEAVSGACMLIRRQALAEIGYFDEAYGLHCEDLDLMYRLQQSGWQCLYVPAAQAVHEQGVSSRSRPAWVHRQKHLGMARFYRKFLADQYAAPVTWAVLLGIWLHYFLLLPVAWLRK